MNLNRTKPKSPKRNEPKPRRESNSTLVQRRESNPTLVQRFHLYALLYPLSYREMVTIYYKMAIKNPRRHLRQNRPKSYYAVNGKIDTTLVESAQVFLCQMKVFYHRNSYF